MSAGFIFPAFVSEYKHDEPEILRQFSDDFERLFKEASLITGSNLTAFHPVKNDFRNHELESQFISYIFSCAVSDILKKNKIKPDYLAGYSMGLYAAMYCGESVSFGDGLRLIKSAFELIRGAGLNADTGMGSIVGLERNDIEKLITGKPDVTIANTNGTYSFLISGIKTDISDMLESARLEGALHVSLMNVSCPYHSAWLNEASDKFRNIIEKDIVINDSLCRIVSGLDQRIFSGREEIIGELAANLNHPINWMKTMEKMISLNVNRFIECGAGTSLHKIGKFIEGDFRIIVVSELLKEFEV